VFEGTSGFSEGPLETEPMNATRATSKYRAPHKNAKRVWESDVIHVEPYLTAEGKGAFAIVSRTAPQSLELHEIEEWKRIDPRLGEELEKEFDKKIPWLLPSEPYIEFENLLLYQDVVEFSKRNIAFNDPRHHNVIGHWIIASHIIDQLNIAPRIIAYGPTRSGKSRVLSVLKLLSYRAVELIDPSSPSVFRTTNMFKPTTLIDEYQDMMFNGKSNIDQLFKAGFDKNTKIPRTNMELQEVEYFDSYGMMAIGTKKLPAEDMQNRSILINMIEADPDSVEDRIDEDAARELRTHLLAFRLRALSGQIDVSKCLNKAWDIARKPCPTAHGDIRFDSRTTEMLATLLVPGVLYGGIEETLGIMMESYLDSMDGLRMTSEAETFFALQAITEPHIAENLLDGTRYYNVSDISTRDVADQLNKDRFNNGDSEGGQVQTRTVTETLKALGFRFKSGTQNKSYFIESEFQRPYEVGLRKFGRRGVSLLSDNKLTS